MPLLRATTTRSASTPSPPITCRWPRRPPPTRCSRRSRTAPSRSSSSPDLTAVRVVVTGATGNVGTSVVAALAADRARARDRRHRPPAARVDARRKTRWVAARRGAGRPAPAFAGADVVIHLAWLIQPSRDGAELERVNVRGSRRVFEAAAEAGVSALVHASSVGVYSAGPEGPCGRRVLAACRRSRAFLLAPQGAGRARCSTRSRSPSRRCVSCGCVPA